MPRDTTVIQLRQPAAIDDPLTELACEASTSPPSSSRPRRASRPHTLEAASGPPRSLSSGSVLVCWRPGWCDEEMTIRFEALRGSRLPVVSPLRRGPSRHCETQFRRNERVRS
jgi:hypothetical protein